MQVVPLAVRFVESTGDGLHQLDMASEEGGSLATAWIVRAVAQLAQDRLAWGEDGLPLAGVQGGRQHVAVGRLLCSLLFRTLRAEAGSAPACARLDHGVLHPAVFDYILFQESTLTAGVGGGGVAASMASGLCAVRAGFWCSSKGAPVEAANLLHMRPLYICAGGGRWLERSLVATVEAITGEVLASALRISSESENDEEVRAAITHLKAELRAGAMSATSLHSFVTGYTSDSLLADGGLYPVYVGRHTDVLSVAGITCGRLLALGKTATARPEEVGKHVRAALQHGLAGMTYGLV